MSSQTDPTQPPQSPEPTIPKAVLYYHPDSPWSTAVILTLEEKGYGADEVDLKPVDISKGENFEPSFLRINSAGTVPVLVVPLSKYLGPEIETRYKPIPETKAILAFLDKSRTVLSKTKTTSNAPSPVLSPATIDQLAISDQIITFLHSPALQPDLYFVSAQNEDELKAKSAGKQGSFLRKRQEVVSRILSNPDALLNRPKATLEREQTTIQELVDIYNSLGDPATASSPLVQAFYAKSKALWTVDLQAALDTIEKTMASARTSSAKDVASTGAPSAALGPISTEATPADAAHFVLGHQLSLVDLHLFVWLARLVALVDGDLGQGGLEKLGAVAADGGSWAIGSNIKAFWDVMCTRESVVKVYKNGIH